MSNSLVLLSLLYFAITFLALALLVRTKIQPRWKSLLIVAFTAMAMLSHHGWQQMSGWPAYAPLPERFLYHSASIREPNAAKNDPGLIHLWATELLPDGPAPEPRAYTLPYTKEDHRQVQEARERIRNGLPQVGRLSRGREGNGKLAEGHQSASPGASFVLADLPEPALPEK
ncbi:MAG: hypothetical protein NVS9B10_09980 [Nevskia sp.]